MTQTVAIIPAHNEGASIGATVGAGTLAATGFNGITLGWIIVAGITTLFAGLAIKNLIPVKSEEES